MKKKKIDTYRSCVYFNYVSNFRIQDDIYWWIDQRVYMYLLIWERYVVLKCMKMFMKSSLLINIFKDQRGIVNGVHISLLSL